jgi:hypothetical protein
VPRQRRKLTYRPNLKVPHVPVSERKIKKIEDLHPQYQRVLDRYPPDVDTETATEIRGLSRSSLYAAAAEGRVVAVKDGASIKWNVLSLLLDLANLPVANFSPAPGSRQVDQPHETGATTPPIAAPSIAASTTELAANESAAG